MNRPEKPNLILSALERLNAELATLLKPPAINGLPPYRDRRSIPGCAR